jgi:hypothetical protein
VAVCLICDGAIDGPQLKTADGGALHPDCFADRLPQDTIVALLAAVGFVLTYTTLVWAG